VELRQFVMLAFQVSILCIVFGFGLRACRHPGIALSIASANFPDEQFAGTILLYLIINAVVGMAYLGWRRRQVVAAASSDRTGRSYAPTERSIVI
jgi:hypothetical protein